MMMPKLYAGKPEYVYDSEIRLVGGKTNFDGEVEIKYKNIWRKIQSFSGKKTVDWICSFLGFNFSSDAASTSTRQKDFSYLFQSLQCRDDESDISLCRSSDWGNNYVSGYSYSAGVNCYTPVRLAELTDKVTDSEIRLVGGKTNFDGEIEIEYKNIWRKIQSFSGKKTVDWICSFLGFNFSR
ncbi:NETR-like protein [Mya arenaria]|uniref:NETR-like protein n=1 Tax=Mya arenaria TaxID=6604 RepID=A0ABY7DFY7_MYAAR|nr:NETR-like protein [Mya arenaria]